MPIGLHPDRTVKVYLGGDLADHNGDKAKCPFFLARFLTCAQVLELEELITKAVDPATSNRDAAAALDEALKLGIVGSGNMPLPSHDAVMDILTVSEKWELVHLMQTETRLAEVDRKNSGSAQGSAASAPSATTPAAA